MRAHVKLSLRKSYDIKRLPSMRWLIILVQYFTYPITWLGD